MTCPDTLNIPQRLKDVSLPLVLSMLWTIPETMAWSWSCIVKVMIMLGPFQHSRFFRFKFWLTLEESLGPDLAWRSDVVIRARDWECRGTTSCDHEYKGTQESDGVMISMFGYGQYIVERGTSSEGMRSCYLDKQAEFVEPTPWALAGLMLEAGRLRIPSYHNCQQRRNLRLAHPLFGGG